MNVLIYGIGNFGYAFLKHLDNKNDGSYQITAYDYNTERVNYLSEHYSHPVFHPDTKISSNVTFTNDLASAIASSDVILLAVPSTATREAAQNIRAHATKPVAIVNTAKSLDQDSGLGLHTIIQDELADIDHTYALLAGGTIASDLFAHEPLGVDLACTNSDALPQLVSIFESSNLRVYPTTDLAGVEYASAFKNIISILAGIVNGLGLPYGAETHVISRTAHHIGEACVSELGAKVSTFSIGSQCWGNDMWMSCTGNTRNRQFGKLIGAGASAQEALTIMAAENKLVEGVNTMQIIDKIPAIYNISVVKLLHEVVVQNSSLDSLKNYLR